MKELKKILIIFILLPLWFVSCDREPSIENGNYLFENQELVYLSGFPVQWSDIHLSEEIKETVWEILDSMVLVEGGSFEMGGDNTSHPNEVPGHTVVLSDFYIAKATVTQKQWSVIMGKNELWDEKYGKGNDYPANYISYYQALNFVHMLNLYSGLHFRMPTEAEWEYAALGGKYSHGFIYSGSNIANEVAWSRENTDTQMHISALLKPNELGLYDMSGNLWEWCSDYYGDYSWGEETNPTGPVAGDKHVLRGGSFTYDAIFARCKARNQLPSSNQSVAVGLRLVLEP